jgi:hypothetical protein
MDVRCRAARKRRRAPAIAGVFRGEAMIAYSLKCDKGHFFDGWFASSTAYDDQAAAGLVACPECASTKVEKAPMAPAVAGTKRTTLAAEERKKVRQFVAGMKKYIKENADYVGKDFPEEARKIHYGETDERHIYGEASLEEAKELIEEGVEIAALPPEMDEETN